MKQQDDLDFLKLISKQLDDHAGSLDNDTLSRLDSARAQALAQQQKVETPSPLLLKVRDALVESERLPSAVELELNKIRAQAVARASNPQHSLARFAAKIYHSLFASGFGLGHGMAATACLTIAVASLVYEVDEFGSNIDSSDELAIVASSEELELYENLDFYLWLADNEFLN